MVASRNNASIRWHYSTTHGWPLSLLEKLDLSDLKVVITLFSQPSEQQLFVRPMKPARSTTGACMELCTQNTTWVAASKRLARSACLKFWQRLNATECFHMFPQAYRQGASNLRTPRPPPAPPDFSGRLGEVAARSDRPGGGGGQAFRRRRCASGSSGGHPRGSGRRRRLRGHGYEKRDIATGNSPGSATIGSERGVACLRCFTVKKPPTAVLSCEVFTKG